MKEIERVKETGKERKIERGAGGDIGVRFHLLFYSPKECNDPSREPKLEAGTQSRSSKWMAGIQFLEPSSTASQSFYWLEAGGRSQSGD